jgi:serine/threonine-protein kinase
LKGVHVATAIDAGVDGPLQIPYVVTALLSGETLEEAVRKRGPLDVDELLEYMRQLAAGLEIGHRYVDEAFPERGPVVHGNLKPGSIFLTRRLSIPWVVILDFGLAEGLEHARGSIARGRLRPPLYTAYEQLCGYTVTQRADIWALGLVAFYMLTGHHYWRASDAELDESAQRRLLFDEVLNRDLVPPSVRAAELACGVRVPRAFDAWFAKCLDRDPEERFTSADVAVDSLAEALSAEHTARRRRAPNHHRLGRWAIAGALLGAVILISMWARHATMRSASGAPAPAPMVPHDARSP